jgi:hypothetical protein
VMPRSLPHENGQMTTPRDKCARLASVQGSDHYETQPGIYTENCEEIGDHWLCTAHGEGDCEVTVPVAQPVCRLRRLQ